MGETFTNERDGQIDFYQVFIPRIDESIDVDQIITDNTDGIIRGNLLEFKLNTTDLNLHLSQCIRYLSNLRIKGKPVPANILIIDLNKSMAWLYKSAEYLQYIEEVYIGGASRGIPGFVGGKAEKVLNYDEPMDAAELIEVLKSNEFTKIHIDENCIVGWANHFYRIVPGSRKEDFIGDETGKHKKKGEIRYPVHLADYIYPYTGKSNVKFNYLMDRLNDSIQKKNLGAFYTPPLYAEKSLELLRLAIDSIPEGNDYIILDRCAGTGNLEEHMTDEELSHCVISTIEYYEYKVLQELVGAKVRHIIPPVEAADTFNAGYVNGADALSKEYIENPVITQYVENPKCNVILFENPPFAETTSAEHQKAKKGTESSVWKKSYVVSEMKKEIKGPALNDMGNAFIWSGFKYSMFCAGRYITYNREWTERARIMKSADGSDHFFADVKSGKLDEFMLRCLLFTCLEVQNHMKTINGSDGRFYRNELCFDTTHGETLASKDIKHLKMSSEEKALMNQWNEVLSKAKDDKRFNQDITYGVYQIADELDTSHKNERDETVYDNIELHTALAGLKTLLKPYYNQMIVPTLFKYEFLK